MLVSRKNKTTRTNELMSFLTVEDLYGQYEVIVFPKILNTCASILRDGGVLLFGGRLSIREDDAPKLVADSIAVLDKDARRLPEGFDGRGSYGSRNGAYSKSGRSSYNGSNGAGRAPTSGGATGAAGSAAPAASPAAADSGNPAKPVPKDARVLFIRYFGQSDDDSYRRLLAMLQYFHGETPVRLYLAVSGQTVDLPHTCWIELSNEILQFLAQRYGPKNLAIM